MLRSGKSGYPCLFFRGKAFSRSLLNVLTGGVSYMAFTVLRYVPSTCFVESFCHERY